MSNPLPRLFTIGYEGRGIDEFISVLRNYGVTRLIDVREIPLSRKKGFSKSALKERLRLENINYIHMKRLGSPAEIRNKLKRDWDFPYFFSAYSKYLSQNQAVIEEIYEYLREGVNCIMCFERYPEKCHRSALAAVINESEEINLEISHI